MRIAAVPWTLGLALSLYVIQASAAQNPASVENTTPAHSDAVTALAFSHDGKWLASGSADSSVMLWEVESGRHARTLRGHVKEVSAVEFSPSGKLIASAGEDGEIKIWELDTGQEVATLSDVDAGWKALQFSSDGRQITCWRWLRNPRAGLEHTEKTWDLRTQQIVRQRKEQLAAGAPAVTSPDGRWVVSPSWSREEYWVKLYDTKTQDFKLLSAHKGEVLAVMFSRDSRWLASASRDKTVKIWDPSRRRVLHTLKGHRDHVLCIAFSPDGRFLASGSKDKTLKLWDVEAGTEIRTLGAAPVPTK